MQALSIAYGGMNAAMKSFEASAAQTVRASLNMTQTVAGDDPTAALAPDSDLITPLIDQKLSSQAFSANVAVAKTADEMIGRLLDIKA